MWWYNNFQNCARPPSWISKFWKIFMFDSYYWSVLSDFALSFKIPWKSSSSAPADPAMHGSRGHGGGGKASCLKIFSSLQDHALFQVFYGFACLKNLSVDPLARFDRIFLAGIRHFDFDECTLTASCKPATTHEILLYGACLCRLMLMVQVSKKRRALSNI